MFAFQFNQIELVTIPESVTSIGFGAFDANQADSEDLTIRGRYGSEAETYALNNMHTFLAYFYVSFEDWDGTALSEQEVDEGDNATAPADPTREGYIFTSWDTDFTDVEADLTVGALYEEMVFLFNVTFNSMGGSPVAGYQAEAGSLLTMPDPPTLDGDLFDGWYREESLINEWNFFADTMPASDLVLYAKWEEVLTEPEPTEPEPTEPEPTEPEPTEPPAEDDEDGELPKTGGSPGTLMAGLLALAGGSIFRKRRD